ncbi:hypothetical protein SVIO_034820 [Streptomyces violaceusniger]|uniref:Signal peptidase II n=1 Tax=Streptomyces violaceusniger TaxID=68280 RepID=A0A4D4L4A8_STRVO|nr:hypothetical protein SVIO_034820 [Streptomyces violaceusniger]
MTEAEQAIGTPDAGKAEEGAGAGAAGSDEAAAGRGKRRVGVLLTVAALAYLIDLTSKLAVVAKLEHHAPVEVIGTWLQFEVIRNRGRRSASARP